MKGKFLIAIAVTLLAAALAYQHISWRGTWYVHYVSCPGSCCCPRKGDSLYISQSIKYDKDIKITGGTWRGNYCYTFDWDMGAVYWPWPASDFYSGDSDSFSTDLDNVYYDVSFDFLSDDNAQYVTVEYEYHNTQCSIELLSGSILQASLALIAVIAAVIML
mmetsp:Transcript_15156/g.12893  ORF Transcript_15156/g.12893 Transcript_15156/m.12893 type:complete len:162 (+) Transcript_15156:67-552(+)|eukprot:CAMPEP_0114590574 /NCGR_PEP_ID=MMETSP0125-20121206/12803_1 /TAXON_ID=485358 ORGANISM="Aristerostoma sp., Strain ATCC 50986" /NCGR_SAMPLE_ID=MMETSP0125 /ASSEMBLY_ACC=CAM_ASM_000245 /LENGTH=161 /DNA_ID=CAMNT_0001788159 /DNA_START=39 /DNA_END=524 /DNA_ORIENTATION=+